MEFLIIIAVILALPWIGAILKTLDTSTKTAEGAILTMCAEIDINNKERRLRYANQSIELAKKEIEFKENYQALDQKSQEKISYAKKSLSQILTPLNLEDSKVKMILETLLKKEPKTWEEILNTLFIKFNQNTPEKIIQELIFNMGTFNSKEELNETLKFFEQKEVQKAIEEKEKLIKAKINKSQKPKYTTRQRVINTPYCEETLEDYCQKETKLIDYNGFPL